MGYKNHAPCPKCREIGNDTSGDNLILYSDGGAHCFACGYHVHSPNKTGFHKQLFSGSEPVHNTTSTGITLPADCITTLPIFVRNKLKEYALTEQDIKQHRLLWSESLERLIFPLWNSVDLWGWQGRYYGLEKKAKWFSQGKLHDNLHLIKQGSTRVLTEDIISAIRCSTYLPSMPLFGTNINNININRLYTLNTTHVLLWLDPDKKEHSVKLANKIRLLIPKVSVIFSDKDPKEYTNDELLDYLRIGYSHS